MMGELLCKNSSMAYRKTILYANHSTQVQRENFIFGGFTREILKIYHEKNLLDFISIRLIYITAEIIISTTLRRCTNLNLRDMSLFNCNMTDKQLIMSAIIGSIIRECQQRNFVLKLELVMQPGCITYEDTNCNI